MKLVCTAITASFLLTPAFVAAEQDVIERCRETGSDAERIACLEAAILAGGAGHASASAVAGGDGGVDGGSPTPTLPREAGEGDKEAPTPTSQRAAEASDEQIATATFPREAGEGDNIAELGAEQVAARNRTREFMQDQLVEAADLEVEKFETVGYRKLQVHLRNGQIWRQIGGDTQRIRVDVERNPTVTISESALGGYRMRLDGIRRIIRVQRIR